MKFRHAYKKWHDNRTDENDSIRLETKREYQRLSRKARRESWCTFCSDLEKTPESGRILKILKSKPTSEIGILRRPDGTFTQTPREAVDILLATHFPDSTPVRGE